MKRFYLFLFLIIPFLFSCKYTTKEYYVIITVEDNPDMTFHSSSPEHFETTSNIEFKCKYSLVPSNNSIKIGDVEVYSTDTNIIEILNIDSDNYIITAKTKNPGTAKVRVITQNYHSNTTLYIEVK